AQLGGGDDAHDLGTGGDVDRDVGGDEGDGGAAGEGRFGERDPLTARGPVAQEPHGVEELAGATGGDDDVATGEVARAVLQDLQADRVDRLGVGQAPGPGVGAGETAGVGVDHEDTPLTQRRDVGDRGGVLPHLGVHGR